MNQQEIKHNCNKDGSCSGCGECCTEFIPMTQEEVDTIRSYVKKNNIQEIRYLDDNNIGILCPFRDQENKCCTIYEVRPNICRLFKCDQDINTIEYNKYRAHVELAYNRMGPKGDIINIASMHSLIFSDFEWEGQALINLIKDKAKGASPNKKVRILMNILKDCHFRDELTEYLMQRRNNNASQNK